MPLFLSAEHAGPFRPVKQHARSGPGTIYKSESKFKSLKKQ